MTIRINPPSNSRLQQSGAEAIYDGAGNLFVKAYLRNGHYQDTIWKILPTGEAEVVWSPPDTHSGSNGMFLDPQGRLWHIGANSAIPAYLKAELVPGFVPVPRAASQAPLPDTAALTALQTQVAALQKTVVAQADRITFLEKSRWTSDTDWEQANNAIRNFFDHVMQLPALIGGKAAFEQYIRDIVFQWLLVSGKW